MTTTGTLFDIKATDIRGGLFDLLPTVEATTTTEEPTVSTVSTAPVHSTFVATLSTGEQANRSSRTKTYTHAVETCRTIDGKHGAYSWHTSQAHAVKASRSIPAHHRVVGIVEATGHAYNSPAAKAARAK